MDLKDQVSEVTPIIDYNVKKLCVKPYHNHKFGCPNWNKREGCPPKAKKFEDIVDMQKPIYCIWNKFDLGRHIEKMRVAHPKWSKYQLRCCLYWQGTARKQLRKSIERHKRFFSGIVLTVPEAHGVNVTETMKRLGIELEWPPEKYAYQIALAGSPKRPCQP